MSFVISRLIFGFSPVIHVVGHWMLLLCRAGCLVVLVRLSVPVKVTDWKDSSLK